ncbi:hypothetical protein DFH28DRAFT_467994 [Melampsora americana]|nr:hypothetical protein DFH28DRAFT_467994 [Melampsora americana]
MRFQMIFLAVILLGYYQASGFVIPYQATHAVPDVSYSHTALGSSNVVFPITQTNLEERTKFAQEMAQKDHENILPNYEITDTTDSETSEAELTEKAKVNSSATLDSAQSAKDIPYKKSAFHCMVDFWIRLGTCAMILLHGRDPR